MKRKLWIVYWVMAAQTIAVGLLSKNFGWTEGFAIATAVVGYAAFLVEA